ncbi:Fpg/Nei family DNA glycosylase [Evansella tamaricis]|uniref:Formamidopyrimidine-DNA glycosylase n=1 Tax=Evansella tamaricis TaxID=2069301 RepID=A0ABS6JMW8_9BACI|nr:DNA-formamidopyrimidine glycosylase family protein [Evansella tamaricis]MBU9714187.1 endonuclease VIII [Evansella tamaricis]
MPELPEMENYKKLLSNRIVGKTIDFVEVTREKTVNLPLSQFTSEVVNCRIVGIERRAKYLIFQLNSGKNLVVHLMLGGLIYLGTDQDAPDRTKQVTLSIGSMKLYFIGLRLGFLHLLSRQELISLVQDLGPEPLDASFTLPVYQDVVKKKRGILKTTLLNQKVLSGIGNLYSDEICYHAMVLPGRKISDLNEQEKITVYHSMKTVLQRGIQLGGYMDTPVFKGDTLTGQYNDHCYVYDREGESCQRCHGTIVKVEISSRKSFYCPQCQK